MGDISRDNETVHEDAYMGAAMQALSEIEIIDFRSFTNQAVSLHDITCVVGANESGKTNLLEAISHLAPDRQNVPFTPNDIRIGAPDYPSGRIEIRYSIELSRATTGKLVDDLPSLEGKSVKLIKRGRPRVSPKWTIESNIVPSSIPDIICIHNKTAFLAAFRDKGERTLAKERREVGWFPNDASIDLRTNPYKQLLQDGKISLEKGSQKIDFIHELVMKAVLANVKLYKWQYEEEHFLKETVDIASFLEDPLKYVSVRNMLLIAGWKEGDFAHKLLKQSSLVYTNLMEDVERQINRLIKRHWTTHKHLRLKLIHTGTHLTIHLHEPGSITPPEFRSDGLKWFLTFLINFRAQAESMTNYILLIDEPGIYLHPRGQRDALTELGNLSKVNQVVYTTHQTFMIDKNDAERVRVLERSTEKGRPSAGAPFFASRIRTLSDPKNILTDKLLREALGFKVSDISPINEKNILVEGVFDREMLHLANERWHIIDLNEVSIIACGKASNIAKHASLYCGNDLKVVCFYDSDNGGKDALKSNSATGDKAKRQIRDFQHSAEFETIEDLIPDRIFDEAWRIWAKANCVTGASPSRPRMKNSKKHFSDDKKIELKHGLEDALIGLVKRDIVQNEEDYRILKTVLDDLKNRM